MRDSDRDRPFQPEPLHSVRFYEDRQALARIVAGYITEAWLADDPVILLVTAEHRQSIFHLTNEIGRLIGRGELIAIDAHEALEMVMVDGMPSAKRFYETILPVIDKAAEAHNDGVVRIYGDTAGVLWSRGQEAAAIALEEIANRLMSMRRVSIMCGYSMSNLYGEASFARICGEHTHVISADGVASEIGPGGVI